MDGWSRKKWILVYVLAVVLGTLFHFVYGFTGENRIVGYFFPINESTSLCIFRCYCACGFL